MAGIGRLRRIVTGHNEASRSALFIEGPPPRSIASSNEGGLFEIWNTDGGPVDTRDRADRADCPVKLSPEPRGSKFWYFVINSTPRGVTRKLLEEAMAALFEKIGAAHERVDATRHPGMHKTKTIDYIILLKGDVTLLLDDGEVQLAPFNTVVQRGTNHAWIVTGDEPALFAAVLIDCDIM